MGIADIVIFFTSLLPYLTLVTWPIIGWAFAWLWWFQDLLQAYHGINFDGTIQWTTEKIANTFTGLLWISLIGWEVYSAIKIAKSPQFVSLIDKVILRLKTLIANANKYSLYAELYKDQKTYTMGPEVIKYLQGFLLNVGTKMTTQKVT